MALSRLEKRGRGILLLHDIHPWTATALPDILKELKDHGFHLVQVVPTPGSVAAAVEAASETTVAWTPTQQDFIDNAGDALIWPSLNPLAAAEAALLEVPDADAFDSNYLLEPATPAKVQTAAMGGVEEPVPIHADLWPEPKPDVTLASNDPELPAPDIADIGWPLKLQPRAIETPPVVLQAKANVAASRGRRRVVGVIPRNEPKVAAHAVAHHPARIPAGAAKRASLGTRLASRSSPGK